MAREIDECVTLFADQLHELADLSRKIETALLDGEYVRADRFNSALRAKLESLEEQL
jgi:hypothetical protein